MGTPFEVLPRPCDSCPYRRDTPPGLWRPEEYEKLVEYDDGGKSFQPFLCHQTNMAGRETLCRGWLTVAANSIAVRLLLLNDRVTVEQVDAPIDVPLYKTGKQACRAGLAGVKRPTRAARAAIAKLVRKKKKKPGAQ